MECGPEGGSPAEGRPEASADQPAAGVLAAFPPAETTKRGVAARLALLPRTLLRAPILLYRYSLSSFMGRQCRYLPTCSEFADEAIARHGAWAGGWMAAGRLCRCHPWGGHGIDRVPECLPQGARWNRPWRYGRWRAATEGDAPSAEG